MGTPALVNEGTISFESPERAQEALAKIKAWVEDANNEKLSEGENGDYDIRDLELNVGTSCVTFKAYSSRYQNLEWQMENLLKVCKPLSGIKYFQAPIWIESEDSNTFWSKEDEDLGLYD